MPVPVPHTAAARPRLTAGGPACPALLLQAIAVDSSGNYYVGGWFQSSMALGSHTLSSAGAIDVFVAKFTPTGSVSWAKSYGGSSGHEYMGAVAVDRWAGGAAAGRSSSRRGGSQPMLPAACLPG